MSEIASTLGTPIMADKNTMSKDRIGFAHVVIDVPVSKEVLFFYQDAEGHQRVDYCH